VNDDPPRVLVAVYEYGTVLDHLTIPASTLREAERILDEERSRRRHAAEEARAAAEREAGLWQRLRVWMRGQER
jgi:hypothetical protein